MAVRGSDRVVDDYCGGAVMKHFCPNCGARMDGEEG